MSLVVNSWSYHPIIILLINTKVNIQQSNVSQYLNVTHVMLKSCLEKRGDLIYNIVNTRGGNVDAVST